MGNAIQTLRTKCKFLKDGNMPLADVANKVIEFSKSHGLEFDSLDKATEFIKGILGQNTESVNFQGFQSVMNALKGKLQGK